MSKKKKLKWSMNPSDVARYGLSFRSSGRSKASQSRVLDTSSKQWSLIHTPTNLEVKGNIPERNYSKKEMQKLEEILFKNLFKELEVNVAKKLRIAGYT